MIRRFAPPVLFAALLTPVLPGLGLAAPQASGLGFAATMQRIEAQGFRIIEANLDDGSYEIEAYGKDGRKVHLRVDLTSAEILRRESDD